MWKPIIAGLGITTGVTVYAMYSDQRSRDTKVIGRISMKKNIPSMREKFANNCVGGKDTDEMDINGFINSFLPDGMERKEFLHLGPTSDIVKILNQLDADRNGILSYGEYCTLISLLSTPEHILRKSFIMFDANSNAALDQDEFIRMMKALNVDHSAKLELSESIKDHFFGKDRKKELPYEEFADVVSNLRSAVRSAEFDIFDVSQSGMLPSNIIRSLMTREKAVPSDSRTHTTMVTKSIYVKFCDVLRMSEDVLRAFDIFVASKPGDIGNMDRRGLRREEFGRAVRSSGITLSSEEIDIFFAVFYPDNNSETIDFREIKSMCAGNPTFFSSHPIDFREADRNGVQQFVHCMRQL